MGAQPPAAPVWLGWDAGRVLPWLTEPCQGPGHGTWPSPAASPSNPVSVSFYPQGVKPKAWCKVSPQVRSPLSLCYGTPLAPRVWLC